jgi:hypothetical protein
MEATARHGGSLVPGTRQYASRTGNSSTLRHAAVKSRTRPSLITHKKTDFAKDIEPLVYAFAVQYSRCFARTSGLLYLIK